jgi:SAM-dependent methyltransferase
VALLAPKPGEVVLELAAGIGDTGFLAAPGLEPEGRLLTTDASPEMLAAARRRATELGLTNVEFRQVDATSIDLDDGTVDGVLCRFGIMLLGDPGRALSEIARVLRPGGRTAVAVWASADENDWMTATGRAALELGFTERPDPGAPGPFRLADTDELTDFVATAGLRVAALEDVPVCWRVGSRDEWWEAVRDTSPTLEALLDRLSSEQTQALRSAAARRLERHVAPDGSLAVPGAARALLAVKDG